jgi:DNA-binding PadR family transcriptional regulator
MAAKHAVLGLVIERADHGYELARRLQDRCGPWAWSRPTVYKALEDLDESKYVCALGGARAASNSPPRTVYEATPRGVDYFGEWMFGEAAMEASRFELELKIMLARPHELPTLIDMTWKHEHECVERLAVLGRETRRAQSDDSGDGDALSWADVGELWTKGNEIKRLRLRVECLQEGRRTMQMFLDRTTGTSSHRPRQGG